jgi:hypothetical protein
MTFEAWRFKDMPIDRRSFVAAAAIAAAIRPSSLMGEQSESDQRRDPLGVRDNFPIISDHIFLNSAYIAAKARPRTPLQRRRNGVIREESAAGMIKISYRAQRNSENKNVNSL